jgi:4-amino-4-deoxy-L-arabinose transferase-like glycosyltransferase
MSDPTGHPASSSATALVDDAPPGAAATTVAPPEVEQPPWLDEPGTVEEPGPREVDEPAGLGRAPQGDSGAPDRPSPPARFPRRVIRGRDDDPIWVRPSLLTLLAGTAVLYIWGLGANGWANSFYSAAVEAGAKSWKALLFGSFDSSNFITVDKPPAFLWVMDLSARIFGVNSWSILVPQAIEGVLTVLLVYLCVRRFFTPGAALIAGAVVALTPVATLMFKYNNPDALLTLLLTASAYATIRALERGRSVWLVAAGVFTGFAFLTKQLEGLIVLPVIGLVYLLCGPPKLGRRLLQCIYLGIATVVAGGWWVALVQLTPASARPYVGGSTDNSELNLIFGYNGFGRVTGNETGSVGGTGVTGNMWGPTGWTRLFQTQMGGQISWLIPGALIGLAATLWLTRRAPRADRTRAAFLLFGGWLLLMGAVFSFSKGIIHPYYTIALAPAVGALVGMGASTLWARRRSIFPRVALAVALAATIAWSFAILRWSPQWYPALRWSIVIGGGLAILAILLVPRLRWFLLAGICGLGLAAALAGPAAYSLDTAGTPHNGAIPSAGPAVSGGGLGGFGGFGGRGGVGQIIQNINRTGINLPPGFQVGGLRLPHGLHIRPGAFGHLGAPAGAGAGAPAGAGGRGAPGGFGGFGGGRGFGGFGGRPGVGGAAGAAGGLLNASTPGPQLVAMLEADANQYTWVAATTGANSASGYQLATDDPVMAIGGFNGTDPAPTLAAFEKYVAEGRIHYYIGGGGFGGFGGRSGSQSAAVGAGPISTWVSSHFTAQTVDGVTIYNLTTPRTTASSTPL